MRTRPILSGMLTAAAVGAAACGGGHGTFEGIRWPEMDPQDKHFPDVLGARLDQVGRNRYDITVSLSSPYDSRWRWANGWRVLSGVGNFIAERHVARGHAHEQPWTSRLRAVHIPPDVRRIVLEGRDLLYGWGGGAYFLRVPGRP